MKYVFIGDIEAAVEAEQEYLRHIYDKTKTLQEYLEPCGYINLEDYFKDKVYYQIFKANLTIKGYPLQEAFNKVEEAYQSGEFGAFTVDENIEPNTWIWAGRNNEYLNIDKIDNLKIYNYNYFGGPIVTTSEDFNFAFTSPKNVDWTFHYFYDKLVAFLIKKGHNAIIDNNDILVDDKKVAGCTTSQNKYGKLFAMEVSLTDNSELVQQISNKDSSKKVGYLDNITREELIQEVNEWLHST